VELEEVELEEEAIAVPLLLLPQAARIAVAARKRKGRNLYHYIGFSPLKKCAGYPHKYRISAHGIPQDSKECTEHQANEDALPIAIHVFASCPDRPNLFL
jgi:hypothetical protein